MALGLTGCMGQFFGKSLDKMMFLGELSLDGTVRSVRGALSATLAARENGLRSIAVPQSNAPWESLDSRRIIPRPFGYRMDQQMCVSPHEVHLARRAVSVGTQYNRGVLSASHVAYSNY
jgi:Mg-chelatase subunit ChlI-like protein